MLARKISRAKWDPKEYLAETEIPADAISGCLRTTDNALSWWRCTNDEGSIAEVALALTAGPKIDRFDKIDVVVLPEAELAKAGLALKPTKGATVVKDLQSRHVDLNGLDVERLAKVARILGPRIRIGSEVVQFTQARLETLVNTAIHNKRLDANQLSEKLQAKIAGQGGAPPA